MIRIPKIPNWKFKKDNVLIIGDLHAPFEDNRYLDFCNDIRNRCKCGTIVHIGDLVDNHSISYHEHNPDGWSPYHEMLETDEHLKPWFKAFPRLMLCRGNHDALVDRKGKTSGLPRRAFKDFREIWDLPSGWIDGFEFFINGVKYTHGTGYSGRYGHVTAAYDNRRSTVIGHLHSVAGVEYIGNADGRIFGMCVGSGIDHKKYAFAYGKGFRRKPILSCGVVTDRGRFAQIFPLMK